MLELSLVGENVSVIALSDEQYCKNFNICSENQNVYKNIQVLINLNSTQQNIGYLYTYNYNSSDGYIYSKIFAQDIEYKKHILEGSFLLFNYLFTVMPIRKIYYEAYEYEINNIQFIKNLGFKLEANFKAEKFFNNKYNDRYIFSLYREDFYRGNK